MSPSLTLLGKESREMLRDKRIVYAAFIAPVFMIVLFIFLFGYVSTKVGDKSDIPIAIIGAEKNPLSDVFRESKGFRVTTVPSVQEGLALMKDGQVHAVVEFSEGFSSSFVAGDASVVTHFDSDETITSIAQSAVRKSVDEFNKLFAKGVFEQNGLPGAMAEPVKFIAKDEKKSEGLGGSLIIGLIPYLIVIWAFYGGFSAVSDLVAGEKERGTMETLLVSPITRKQAAIGKFLALSCLCLTSSLTTLVGVVLVGVLNLPLTQEMFPTGLHVSALTTIQLVMILVPLALFFAGVLVSVSAYAKNVREAQTLLTLVSFVVIMPAVFSQFIGLTGSQNEAWVAWTPILNSAVTLKSALTGSLDALPLFATVLTSLLLAGASLWATVRLFSREQILSRI